MLHVLSALPRLLLQDDGEYSGNGFSEDPTDSNSGGTTSSNNGFRAVTGAADTNQVADILHTETGLPSDSGIFGSSGTTDSSVGGENTFLPPDHENQSDGQNGWSTAIPSTSNADIFGTSGVYSAAGTPAASDSDIFGKSASSRTSGGWDSGDTGTALAVTGVLTGIFNSIGGFLNGSKKSSGGGVSVGGTSILLPSTLPPRQTGGGGGGTVTPSLQSVLDGLGVGGKTPQTGKTPTKAPARASGSSSLWLILMAVAAFFVLKK